MQVSLRDPWFSSDFKLCLLRALSRGRLQRPDCSLLRADSAVCFMFRLRNDKKARRACSLDTISRSRGGRSRGHSWGIGRGGGPPADETGIRNHDCRFGLP